MGVRAGFALVGDASAHARHAVTRPPFPSRAAQSAAWRPLSSTTGASSDFEAAALVAADSELIVGLAELHPDTVPFLERLRAAGVRTAFVSNCAENTRPLLDALGLVPLVDELVRSCEVGAAKPDVPIYRAALERLGTGDVTSLAEVRGFDGPPT